MQNIHVIPPPPPEEHHEAVNDIYTMVKGIQTQSYELEGLAQANALLTISKSVVMAQLTQINVTLNAIQAQLKTLESAQTNQTSPRRKN